MSKKRILYDADLSEINSIKFTFREVDIISCVLHNRGEKKIAALLQISPRTVGTHLHNIMLKIGKSSRENIIDFIEKSGKLLRVKKYYIQLLIESSFEERLIKIGRTINRKSIDCFVNLNNLNDDEKSKLKKLSRHLNLANVNLIHNDCISSQYNIHFIKDDFIPEEQEGDIFLLSEKPKDENKFSNVDYIYFQDEENYYAAIFCLLTKILKSPEIKVNQDEFASEYNAISDSLEGGNNIEIAGDEKKKIFNIKIVFYQAFIIMIIVSGVYYIFKQDNNNSDDQNLRSELSLPQAGLLLDRSKINAQINKCFENVVGINTVALVGIGGSGKSTIAKKYARSSDASVVWHINAESKGTIISSIKQIAYTIASRKFDKRAALDQILKIKDMSERERGLLLFLRQEAKLHPRWLIIYDSVSKFQDIKKFYPNDPTVWGHGNVIITTSNNNIIHNDNIISENVIRIGSLNKKQKYSLFNSILKGGNSAKDDIDYDKCLDSIPSFPLDVSIAAHYIKETNISCRKYSQYSSLPNTVFRTAQLNILSDVGEYTKTRYDIITLPIEYMIKKSSDFRDLLLMISVLAPRDIPKKLLASYKDDIIVDNFIYELKKFSLITKGVVKEKNFGEELFSIHKSTRNIIAAYFLNNLQFSDNSKQIHNISVFVERYLSDALDKHDFFKIQFLIPHIENLLSNSRLFGNKDIARLNKKLGICYFYLGRYEKAKEVFQSTLKMYDKKTDIDRAKVLARLGGVYRNIADYYSARKCLEKSLKIYTKYYGAEYEETAWVYTTLGSVYRIIGCYNKAKKAIKTSYYIYKEKYGKKHKKTVWTRSYLGQIYKNIGNYSKARGLLETALFTFEKEYGEMHTKTAWSMVHLASVYRSIGYPEKAKEYLEKAVIIYNLRRGSNSLESAWTNAHLSAVYRDLGDNTKALSLIKDSIEFYDKNLSKDHVINGWIKYHLGSVYRQRGDFKKAMEYINQSLSINENHYGKNHIKTAQIWNSLGKVRILVNDFDGAKENLEKSLNIYKSGNHQGSYKPYESMGDMYFLMYKKDQSNNSLLISSIDNYQAAIAIVKKNFPDDSTHINRIKSKLLRLKSKNSV